jgi:formylglycine-generating enzyme required for sulfatase activity/serine/threonine protein kinase
MAKDYDGSLGADRTLQGRHQPKTDDLDTRSLGDQATFAGDRPGLRDNSLGDEMTFGDEGGADEAVDDGMEVVDLSARYKIEKTLGKGGMGEVLLATDTRLERKVAIKRILGEAARSRTAISRFLTEAKSIAALNHPNIVQIYDYGRAKDGPFLIMEFVDGESLLDRTRAGALPLEEAVDLTCQLCDGLALAHDAGIIHRDIKPANILMSRQGIPKLTDFGLAKAETADTGMTMAGAVLGTLDFMPPEQRRDATLTDARSDVWSLAATLYQLVTGKSPKIIKFNDVPKSLQDVLGKALEDTKDDRFQSARDFKQALKQALAAGTEVQLETGDCPHCGARNETSRKFCKKCAQSLEVSCLSCKSKIPMWEEVCGNCGTQQSKQLEERKLAMAAERARAEQLLNEFEFTKAASVARRLGDEPDLRLQQLKGWSKKFLQDVEIAERDQLARVGQLIGEALKHEQAADYPAAIQALEQIPRPLLSSVLSGTSDSAGEILERMEGKLAECKRLEKLIKQRIESRQLSGLLVEVEQLLQLRPDKSDAVKLRKQLQEREAKLYQTRDEAFAAAQSLAAGHDYEAALSELARIDDYVIEEPQQQLSEELQAKVDELLQLRNRINDGLANKKYSGLLNFVDQFLELRPQDQEMLALREQLIARDAKSEAAVQNVIGKANQFRGRGDFEGAIGLLSKIPPELESNTSHELLEECVELAELRQRSIDSLHRGMTNSDFRTALTRAEEYRDRIKLAGISDPEFAQLLLRCQTVQADYERSDAKRKKFNNQLIIGSIAAAVLLLLGVGAYFPLSSSIRAARLSRALAAGDYEEILRLDARNHEGLTLKTRAEAIVGALKAGNYEEVLRLDPKNPEGLVLKDKAEAEVSQKAEAISRALAAGDYEEVLRLDPSKLPAAAISKLSKEAISKLPPLKNSIGLELRLLPAGTFRMGDSGARDEEPHQVTISRPYYLGVYEVTQEQYERVMGANPSHFKGSRNPVDQVSWEDAVDFCRKLSALPEEQAEGRVYRLPTEAEWEYACRANSKTTYYFGDDDSQLGDYAWFGDNSEGKTHHVGEKKPNSWGLCDMHGNVWEWCADWHGDYSNAAVTDPDGAKEGALRVNRGGSWYFGAPFCRSAVRYGDKPSQRNSSYGFRLALSTK